MIISLLGSGWDITHKLLFFVAFLIAVIVAMTVHEFSHAYAAMKCGDNTAKMHGRLTLNPIKHLDFVGFICLMLFGFGWAKPVPVNPMNFKNFKRDTFWVSIAGVLSNLLIAFVSLALLGFVLMGDINNLGIWFLTQLFMYMAFINAIFIVFNLLPIYPLDGFNALAAYLKYENRFVQFMRRYGGILLIALIIMFQVIYSTTGFSIIIEFATYVLWPFIKFWMLIFGDILGVPFGVV